MTKLKQLAAFKDCDIRGKYPAQVNEELFAHVGAAFGSLVARQTFAGCRPGTLVLGHDHRLSTPSLKQAFLRGVLAHPVEVVDLAQVPTPVVYWAKARLETQASAVITASHNPSDYNGLKATNGPHAPTPEDILGLAVFNNGPWATADDIKEKPTSWPSALEHYLRELEDGFADSNLGGLKVVVDAGAGCQAGVASGLLKRLGAQVTALHDIADGRFLHRHPDCAIPAHLGDLVRAVRASQADIGIAFDGDGDRLAIVDDTGQVLGSERVGMILLTGPLQLKRGVPVILDVKCSMQLERLARAAGAFPQRCKSGHTYMKNMVIARNALMGVELSGHIFLQAIEGRDDPLYTALVLSRYLTGTGSSLSRLAADLPDMAMTPDIRVALSIAAIERIIETCKEGMDDAEVETLDGVRLIWQNGWILVRRSITEAKITIRMEGEKRSDLEQLASRFIRVFPDLSVPVRAAVRETLGTGDQHKD